MRSDEELMTAYAARDDADAFRELFDRHGGRLRRIMSRYMGSLDDADDLVQKTFLNVHRARHDFDQIRSFRAWLYTIALNVRREHFRRLQRRPEGALSSTEVESSSSSHSGDVMRRLMLERALRKISGIQREVILLHWYEGMSFPEIAELVGASVSAVKVRAHRGYKALRDALADGATDGTDAASLALAPESGKP